MGHITNAVILWTCVVGMDIVFTCEDNIKNYK